MSSWTEEENLWIYQFKGSDISPKDVHDQYAEEFGDLRSYDSIRRKLERINNASKKGTPDVAKALSGNPTRTDFNLDEDRADLNSFINQVIKKAKEFPELRLATQRTFSDLSSLVICLSDTHFGKHTKNFNLQVAEERILSIPDKILESNIDMSEVDEIVLALVGDMVEGEDIYPTQPHHTDAAVIDQVRVCIQALYKLAKLLAEVFDVQVRIETCPGNHGRVSKSANEKSNWDNVVYQTLGLISMFDPCPQVTVNVSFSTFNTIEVKDKRGLMFHHGTKHTGTPAMKIKHAGWMQQKEHDFMMHGHWHEMAVGNVLGVPVLKNGSLPGEDDLSERMGVYDPPRQGWLLVTPNQPISMFGFFEWQNELLDEGVGSAPPGYGHSGFAPSGSRGE